MPSTWNLCVALVACLALVPTAPAKTITVDLPYDAPAVAAYQGVQDCSAKDAVQRAGVMCLDVPASTNLLELKAADASGLPVGGVYYLHAADGRVLASALFCKGAQLVMPPTTATLVVRMDAVNGPLACLDAGEERTAPATKGVVSARLR